MAANAFHVVGTHLANTTTRAMLALICVSVLSGCASIRGDSSQTESAADGHGLLSDSSALSGSGDYHSLIVAGDDALARQDLDTAQIKYALAVNQQPSNNDGLYKLAIVHYQKKSFEVAREILERVISDDKSHTDALEVLGFIALQKEQLTQAESYFQRTLALQPASWRSLNALGIVNDMQLQHTQARQHFKQALLQVPDNARVENNLGYSYYLQGKYHQSIQHFIRATRLSPDYTKAWSNLGLGFVRLGRYEDARAAFSKLVDSHVAANNLGYLGMLLGDLAMANREITAALRTAPTYYALANENLALLNQRSKRIEQENILLPTNIQPSNPGIGSSIESVAPKLASAQPSILVAPAISRLKPESAPEPKLQAAMPSTQKKSNQSATDKSQLAAYLNFLGFSVRADGTDAQQRLTPAIRDFQISQGLQADGVAGRKTQQLITHLTIKRTQLYLASRGYQTDGQSGIMTNQTEVAIRAFEKDQSLPVDGRLDAQMLARLING